MRVIQNADELRSLVGTEVGVSEWMEVTQSRIDGFADVTEDRQWIHVDVERASKESPLRSTIAHGFLTLSLLPCFISQVFTLGGNWRMGVNYGFNRLRFTAPVPAGARLRGRFVLQSCETIAGAVQLVWVITVEMQGTEKPVLLGEWVVLYS